MDQQLSIVALKDDSSLIIQDLTRGVVVQFGPRRYKTPQKFIRSAFYK